MVVVRWDHPQTPSRSQQDPLTPLFLFLTLLQHTQLQAKSWAGIVPAPALGAPADEARRKSFLTAVRLLLRTITITSTTISITSNGCQLTWTIATEAGVGELGMNEEDGREAVSELNEKETENDDEGAVKA